jgi:hypothetical protein
MPASPRATALVVPALLSLAVVPAIARADPACAPDAVLTIDGLGSPADELARLADLAPGVLAPDSGMMRRGGVFGRGVCAGSGGTPWDARFVAPAPTDDRALISVTPRLLTTWRTQPGGGNDGVLWQGRGASTLLSGGVAGRLGILSAQLAPAVAWSQNDLYEMVPTGQPGNLAYRNAWYGNNLDLPQRFGAGPFARASLGQSYVQLEAFHLQLGVSTENRWLGPGIRNSLLLSNTADGFPHLFFGTARPLETPIGSVELLLLWGRITRSSYFPDQGDRAFTALALAYQPRWIPGLYLGFGREYVESWAALRGDLLLSVLESPIKHYLPGGDNPDDNQLFSLWWRWVLPASGFEFYGEWSRDDHGRPAALVRIPERTSAMTLGVQKLFAAGPRWVRFVGEYSRTSSTVPPGFGADYYTHGRNVGYTHEGQLLGASIGSGGDVQLLAVDVFTASGRIGGYVERLRRNDDIFWAQIAAPGTETDHDAELVAMARQVLFAGPVEVSWEAGGGYRWNRDFIRHEPVVRASVAVAVKR